MASIKTGDRVVTIDNRHGRVDGFYKTKAVVYLDKPIRVGRSDVVWGAIVVDASNLMTEAAYAKLPRSLR